MNKLSRGFAYVPKKIVYKNEKSRYNTYETIRKVGQKSKKKGHDASKNPTTNA
jgi:hypothetical protein